MIAFWATVWLSIGFAPDEIATSNLHPPFTGDGSGQLRANLGRVDAFKALVKMIPISNSTKVALVDDEDYARMSKHTWNITKKGYVQTNTRINGVGSTLKMHRLVMRARHGEQVDHIHHNRLDNRKSELRLATNTQNQYNRRKLKPLTSKYKGVHWRNDSNKYRASFRWNKKLICLGSFYDEDDAARAYNAAAILYFGEFAYLNSV